MRDRPPRRLPARLLPATDRCVPPVDLTAFAHGDLPDWHRAEVSRHLLRCLPCREEAGSTDDLLARLAAVGVSGDSWREDLSAALARARAARWSRARTLGVATAAAVAVLALGVAAPMRGGSTGGSVVEGAELRFPTPAGYALPADEAQALALQADDGRWPGARGREDEAMTGLVVSALVARRPDALPDDTVGRAVRAGAEWLLSRQDGAGRIGGGGRLGAEHALATGALLDVYAATADRVVRAAADLAVRRLSEADRAALSGDAALSSAHRALVRARELGFAGLGPAIHRVESWLGGADRAEALDPLPALARILPASPPNG